jgi:hypothetical protein
MWDTGLKCTGQFFYVHNLFKNSEINSAYFK